MKISKFLIFFIIPFNGFSQKKSIILSLNSHDNFYTLNSNTGFNNNVVRNGMGLTLSLKKIDTIGSKSMTYELGYNVTNAYYYNILGTNNLLNTENSHVSFNALFPMFIFTKGSTRNMLSVGLGVNTLAARDFYDNNNNLLPYNATTLKKMEFGKVISALIILDYNFSFKIAKKAGVNLGFRYTDNPFGNNSNYTYITSQGKSFGFSLGFFYKLR